MDKVFTVHGILLNVFLIVVLVGDMQVNFQTILFVDSCAVMYKCLRLFFSVVKRTLLWGLKQR